MAVSINPNRHGSVTSAAGNSQQARMDTIGSIIQDTIAENPDRDIDSVKALLKE